MTEAFCEMPSEIVGLMLSLFRPDSITYSRINQPMFLSFASHGAYLATSSIAFPEDAGESHLLPALTSGYVYADSLKVISYKNPPATVAPMTADVIHNAYGMILRKLEENSDQTPSTLTVDDLCKEVLPVFKKADCAPTAALVYEILYALHKEGKLRIDAKKLPSGIEGISATVFTLGLN